MTKRFLAAEAWLGESKARFVIIVGIAVFTGGILAQVIWDASTVLYSIYVAFVALLVIAVGVFSYKIDKREKV